MSAVALAATPAAPHPQPRTAAAGVRPRDGGLTVKVPLRLVVGAQYPDAALSVYVKIAALALRPERCRARVSTLATYLGMSKSAVERGLRPLTQPDIVDSLIEVPTERRTARGGTGESAHRTTRPLAEGELWVRIPVRAAEALTPRLLRVYALLAYSTARRIPVTAAELGEMLYHHTGERAGQHLGERQARRLVDDLEETGWLTVRRREGGQGRHAYETRRHPLHAVPAASAEAAPEAALEDQAEQLALFGDGSPVVYDGSGPGDHDGSLASKEDHPTDRRDETNPVGVSRRRRGDRKWVAAAADSAAVTVPDTFRPGETRAPRGNHPTTATPSTPYAGPELRWTHRIHTALAPVRHLLDDQVSRFLLRKAARDIGRQLDDAAHNLMTPERMAARIAARYRDARTITDVGAWLLHVAIVPKGCGQPLCEDGRTWPTGEPCATCTDNRHITSEQWRRARAWDERLAELGHGQALAKATYRQRSAATDEEVLAAAAEHGPAAALHRYGVLRAGELLRAAYGALPELPVAAPQMAPTVLLPHAIEEAPMRDDYMPAEFRAAVGRAPAGGALSRPCPVAGCLAEAGHQCTTPRGRRRAAHTARTAAETRAEES